MGKQTLPHLTSLRGIAAYSVLLAHISSMYLQKMYPAHADGLMAFAQTLAYFGMTLFFVLSGFVITYNYAESFRKRGFISASGRFLAARFARLYPLYFLFLLVSLSPIRKSDSLFYYLTLTQSWNNSYAVAFAHAWSISAEWMFYLLFLLLAGTIARLKTLRSVQVACGLVVFGSYAYLAGLYALRDVLQTLADGYLSLGTQPDTLLWISYYSPYTHICSFLTGCMAARLYMVTLDIPVKPEEKKLHDRGGLICLAAMACLMLLLTLRAPQQDFLSFIARNYLFALPLALLLFSFSRHGGSLQRVLLLPILLLAGEISYSVYIIQHWVFPMVSGRTLLNAALAIVLTTAFAYGSYTIIEAPARRRLREIPISRRRISALTGEPQHSSA